ncbi:hypothetical protein [Formosa sp. 4Alg 33]|uniref:hypothetical protein n=1 Tax=Formosa sp. 4Alg 33 TaxID=3382189 RepID=UPI003D9C181A
MRNSIYILLFITLFSCQNQGLRTELENAYEVSSKYQNDSLIIEEFEILNNETVDFDYTQKIKINSLNYVIELKKSVIEKDMENIRLLKKNILNRNKLIELNETKKEQYLTEIEYDEQRLEKSKNDIKKIEDEIAIISQKIVLTQAEFGQNKDKFELINYVFKGEINDKKRIDTLSILKVSDNEIKFIKNNKFSNYKGE